jgi:hypothetical protein
MTLGQRVISPRVNLLGDFCGSMKRQADEKAWHQLLFTFWICKISFSQSFQRHCWSCQTENLVQNQLEIESCSRESLLKGKGRYYSPPTN